MPQRVYFIGAFFSHAIKKMNHLKSCLVIKMWHCVLDYSYEVNRTWDKQQRRTWYKNLQSYCSDYICENWFTSFEYCNLCDWSCKNITLKFLILLFWNIPWALIIHKWIRYYLFLAASMITHSMMVHTVNTQYEEVCGLQLQLHPSHLPSETKHTLEHPHIGHTSYSKWHGRDSSTKLHNTGHG